MRYNGPTGATESDDKTALFTSHSLRPAATGAMLIVVFFLPFGRPRWLARITAAPCSSA